MKRIVVHVTFVEALWCGPSCWDDLENIAQWHRVRRTACELATRGQHRYHYHHHYHNLLRQKTAHSHKTHKLQTTGSTKILNHDLNNNLPNGIFFRDFIIVKPHFNASATNWYGSGLHAVSNIEIRILTQSYASNAKEDRSSRNQTRKRQRITVIYNWRSYTVATCL